MNGLIGGGQIGYNWQFGPSWIAGVEADFQWSGQQGSATFTAPLFAPAGNTVSVGTRLGWFGTVRARAGATVGSSLWYVTGGWAYGNPELTVTTDMLTGVGGLAAASGTFGGNRSGWTLGGGVETRLTGNWSAKLEYLYLDFGSLTGVLGQTAAGGGPVIFNTTSTVSFRDHIVRAGLNYRF